MALQTYRVEDFKGIDQSKNENKLGSGYSPDAVNMDTRNGDLAVGYGYSKHIADVIPGTGEIRRLYLWRRQDGDRFVVVAGNTVYAYLDGAWTEIHTYSSVTSDQWDFLEARIGNTDYLIIANGQTQLIKWSGTGAAELFGTGEYVFESTVASVSYNATKATKATYSEADKVGTFTLTMPSGWSGSTGDKLAFVVPSDMGTLTSTKIAIGSTTYSLSYVPIWSAGDTVMAEITGSDTADPIDDDYGILTVTLADAVPEAHRDRLIAVGLRVDGITYPVDEIDGTGLVVTFNKPCKKELTSGMTATIRGGLSNIAVNYVELYYNRLFAAGDSEHPSRLYWSQPPGDTRSIEDWSMDDVSDTTGGGHTEIGTASDPIVGLCAMSNQLLIFKRSSIYRLLGDRPSNYRVVLVTGDADSMANTSRVSYRDVPYWMTKAGMYYHNGQSSGLTGTALQIRDIIEKADLSRCKAAENRDRLYFTCRMGNGTMDDSIIVFDINERAYMLRNGFTVADICSLDGKLYMVNDHRYVYVWDESKTYDGEPINAYWNTPKTDLSAKTVTKALKWLYARGEGDIVLLECNVGGFVKSGRYQMPEDDMSVIRVKLENEGRVFGFRIYNEAGSWFRLNGGVEVRFEAKEDG